MENLTLKLESNESREIIFREGQALPPVAPKKILITGDIRTVSSFIEKRNDEKQLPTAGYQWINPDRAIVEVDKDKGTIALHLDPEDEYGPVITAKLEFAPELLQFSINKDRKFTREELIKLIRFNKFWFDSPEAQDTLLKAYMAFSAEVNAKVGAESDNRGNRANSFNKTVTTNIPTDFILNIPIFKGMPKRRFRVEIALDSTDGSTKFWLESVELVEIIQVETDLILNAELESCKDYVIVWK